MADTTRATGYDAILRKVVDLGDGTFADAVVDFNSGSIAEDAVVLAAPTGSAGGLGKLAATIANTQDIYVRCDCSARPYTYVDWVVSHAQQADMVFYKSQAIVDEVTATLASFADTNTLILNGLTYTGESTANTVNFASREFSVAGDDDADAAALAAIINADYAVVTAGTSVAGTDKLVITTDEGAHTIVAAATADYPAGKYGLSATAATELASIVLAINHRDTIIVSADASSLAADTTPTEEAQDYALSIELIADHNTHTALTTVHKQATAAVSTTAATSESTLVAQANATRTAMLAHYADTAAHNAADATNLATVVATTAATDAATARTLITALAGAHAAHIATAQVQAGDTVTVNGIVFVAHADTTTAGDHEFAVNGANASADADELVTCLNDSTDGVGATLTALNASGSVALTRDAASSTVAITAAPAAASVHSCITIEEAGGVPGVIAAASPLAAGTELSITPTWTAVLTVTEAGDQLTVTDIDCPGILATASTGGIVTLTPGLPGAPTGQELATVISATAAANCTVSQAGTLSGLYIDVKAAADNTAATNHAATTGSAGAIFTQEVGGAAYCYLKLTADNATPQAVSVSAIKRL